MVSPDYRCIKNRGNNILVHSAKGSTWKEHKYIKRKNGTYYYPDNYEGGRHLSKDDWADEESDYGDLTKKDIDRLKMEIIRGNSGIARQLQNRLSEFLFDDSGNLSSDITKKDIEKLLIGVIRKNFGSNQNIQDSINEILFGPSGERNVSDEVPEETKKNIDKTIKKVESVKVTIPHALGKNTSGTNKGKAHASSNINKNKGIDIRKRR